MTRALLIGGGIAGPVAAMALQRVSIDTTVYEAYPSATKDIGVWLGLQTNGFDALGAIGADRPVAEIGFPTRRSPCTAAPASSSASCRQARPALAAPVGGQ